MPMKSLALAMLLSATLLALASPAAASEGGTIIGRCIHGQSLSGFSQQAYRQALQELPTEVEEYSNCANLIRRAELAAAGGGSIPAAAVIPVSPAARESLNSAPRRGAAPLRVGGQLVSPGVIHASVASAISSLPTPLLATLAFLLVCALLLAGRAIRDRVHAHRAS